MDFGSLSPKFLRLYEDLICPSAGITSRMLMYCGVDSEGIMISS